MNLPFLKCGRSAFAVVRTDLETMEALLREAEARRLDFDALLAERVSRPWRLAPPFPDGDANGDPIGEGAPELRYESSPVAGPVSAPHAAPAAVPAPSPPPWLEDYDVGPDFSRPETPVVLGLDEALRRGGWRVGCGVTAGDEME